MAERTAGAELHRGEAAGGELAHPVDPSTLGGILVVGVEGTPSGDAALAWVLDEARHRHATVEVVMARTTRVAAAAGVGLDNLSDDLCRHLMAQALERVGGSAGVTIDLALEAEEPFLEMALESSAREARMTVIGNHPHRLLHDLLGGRPTSVLTHRGRCPLVVVPVGFARRKGGHLVVGTTTSERGLAALKWAAVEAGLLDASIRAIRVLPTGKDSDDRSVHGAANRLALRQTHHMIDLVTAPEGRFTARVTTGPVPDVLIAEAATAELLIVGAPEHLRRSELLHHALLRTVLARNTVPVVVVPVPASPSGSEDQAW